ncbi:hypothetical protein BABINDRAFT_161704 [Babjeviella inositovora NRRL Y-12698]|uniref:Uncharacterized protein n=1 Tax=Babjeviella inositovora NRRL Y-12698 TaxID=984486 RepID=A0A1E3QR05_9ASCO|nr:uncharacterized protein BABINDRAFT_161704 [Babjeviella inositovora NRRL Y-12698]ODQ80068.1 hypothetical protein BABINDRAFT_161704 [Babjeviella inositovora NRRL Y-12698]
MTSQPAIRDVFSKPPLVAFSHATAKLIAASTNGVIRSIDLKDTTKQPITGDIIENLTCLTVSNNGKLVLITNIDGEVFLARVDRLDEPDNGKKIFRSELPLRSAVFTHGDTRCVVGGDDNSLAIIKLPISEDSQDDEDDIAAHVTSFSLKDSCTNLAYSAIGDKLAVSLSSGNVEILSLTSETPQWDHTMTGALAKVAYDSFVGEDAYIPMDASYACTKVVWNVSGDEFALPSLTGGEIQVYDRSYAVKRTFKGAHNGQIMDLCWSSSGELASLDADETLVVWRSTGPQVFTVEAKEKLTNMTWTATGLAIGCVSGELITYDDILQSKTDGVEFTDDDAPVNLFDDMAGESDEEARQFDIEDDFVIDDDGIGYAEPSKRAYDDIESGYESKKPKYVPKAVGYTHKPYTPGCTPWNTDKRRYLTMNTVGYVWAVKTSSSLDSTEEQIITATFFDRSANTEYYFNDLSQYDMASLTSTGCLFALSSLKQLYYRLNSSSDSWTRSLPYIFADATVTAVTLAGKVAMVALSNSYVLVYTVHGQLEDVMKLDGAVVAMVADPVTDLVFMVHLSTSVVTENGSGSDLRYTIYDHFDTKFYQRGLSLPLTGELDRDLLRGVFFSEEGDPCVVGQDHVLLVLTKWREPQQAVWIPLLDTKQGMVEEVGGEVGKLSSWPLGLFGSTFWCIGLRNNSTNIKKVMYPSFPLPANMEISIKIPVLEAKTDPEEEFIRAKAMGQLLNATISANTVEERQDELEEKLKEYSMVYDKSILQLFIVACQESQMAKAVSLLKLLRDDKALSAAAKIAERFGFLKLVTGITKMRENLMSLEDE